MRFTKHKIQFISDLISDSGYNYTFDEDNSQYDLSRTLQDLKIKCYRTVSDELHTGMYKVKDFDLEKQEKILIKRMIFDAEENDGDGWHEEYINVVEEYKYFLKDVNKDTPITEHEEKIAEKNNELIELKAKVSCLEADVAKLIYWIGINEDDKRFEMFMEGN